MLAADLRQQGVKWEKFKNNNWCQLDSEVAEMEGATSAKQRKRATRSTTVTKPAAPAKTGKGKGKGARGKKK